MGYFLIQVICPKTMNTNQPFFIAKVISAVTR